MENNQNNSEISQNLIKPAVNRGEVFDRFLTYRRRTARLVAVQVAYLYDLNQLIKYDISPDLFMNKDKKYSKDIVTLCYEILYFYKTTIFGPQEYGWNRKNKKVDEIFVYEITATLLKNLNNIDEIISSKLNPNWPIKKLDKVLKAILRCATSEILLGSAKDVAILTSEYTNICSNFFSGKEIGFANGVIQSIAKSLGLEKGR